jgi:Zn-dependent protease
MFGKAYTLFKLLGFSVRVDLSWLVIVALVVWSLAGFVFPQEFPGHDWPLYLVMGIIAAFGLFASIVIHELCHSLVAQRYGLPMKGITLFIFGGVAEMSDEPPSPKAEFLMAIAGPAASLVLGGICLGAAALVGAFGGAAGAVGVLRWVGLINIILVLFNMIPGFPLDGGRVLRSALWQWKKDLRRATQIAARIGSGFGIILIVLGFVSLLMGNPVGGLWWILIGWFVRTAARQSYQQVLVRQLLAGESVSRFMNSQVISVPRSLPVQKLVDDYIFRYHHKMFPVVDEAGHLAGCVSTRNLRELDRSQWPAKTVGDVACDCGDINTIDPQADAMEALRKMSRNQVSRLVVTRQGNLEGVLSLKDLLDYLALKTELESQDAAQVEALRRQHGRDAA